MSEDFVHLGALFDMSFWSAVWLHLTDTLLGMPLGRYYRPVARIVLALELNVWGVESAGYLWTQLLLHLLSSAMVYRLATSWRLGKEMAWGIALIIALYPLHPQRRPVHRGVLDPPMHHLSARGSPPL